ncbi:MAG: hypothetical protein NZ821_10105 [Gloeomargarita sp. SKYB31]|nr:hypothetical protein [Anaerolineae bacterium]MCS7227330.1 hypothetical protein [Gloeomargarita sp. SKYB31]MDW8068149.1 hypothetical protein [Anaerolineae bacterium]
MNRGGLVLLPLQEIQDFVLSVDPAALQRDTVDIFLRFDEENILLVYKGSEKDVTQHSVEAYPPKSHKI